MPLIAKYITSRRVFGRKAAYHAWARGDEPGNENWAKALNILSMAWPNGVSPIKTIRMRSRGADSPQGFAGGFVNGANSFKAFFSPRSVNAILARIENGQASVAFSADGAADTTATLNGNRAEYRYIYPGIDFRYAGAKEQHFIRAASYGTMLYSGTATVHTFASTRSRQLPPGS